MLAVRTRTAFLACCCAGKLYARFGIRIQSSLCLVQVLVVHGRQLPGRHYRVSSCKVQWVEPFPVGLRRRSELIAVVYLWYCCERFFCVPAAKLGRALVCEFMSYSTSLMELRTRIIHLSMTDAMSADGASLVRATSITQHRSEMYLVQQQR